MRRMLLILAIAALAATVIVTPAAATTTRIAVHCDSTRLTDWTVEREWLDSDLVYHIRNETAMYLDVGSPFCAGTNHVTVNVNIDLTTGEGLVIADVHRELAAFYGGWDAKLVAHFTPGGEFIWVGNVVGNGFGELSGYEYRSVVSETTHEATIEDGFVFLPGE